MDAVQELRECRSTIQGAWETYKAAKLEAQAYYDATVEAAREAWWAAMAMAVRVYRASVYEAPGTDLTSALADQEEADTRDAEERYYDDQAEIRRITAS